MTGWLSCWPPIEPRKTRRRPTRRARRCRRERPSRRPPRRDHGAIDVTLPGEHATADVAGLRVAVAVGERADDRLVELLAAHRATEDSPTADPPCPAMPAREAFTSSTSTRSRGDRRHPAG